MEPKGQFTTERVFDAPLSTVWSVWTDPEMLKQWWGPHNVSIPECEVDLQVGGKFYIVMKAGEAMGPYAGTLWPMMATFTAVEPEATLAYDAEAWTEGQKETTTINQTTEITFAEKDGKTVVNINAVIHTAGSDAGMAVQGMEAGFNQQLDKLNEFLSEQK
ncbi:MAG: SRPBCC domain-containing protein [Candidatus Paceibacterota bacterium]